MKKDITLIHPFVFKILKQSTGKNYTHNDFSFSLEFETLTRFWETNDKKIYIMKRNKQKDYTIKIDKSILIKK